MTTISFDAVGSPADVLQVCQSDSRALKRGEVRVEMLAAPINPSDMMFVRGEYGITPHFPQTPGFEGVGVVREANAGLFGRFLTGKRVAVLHRKGGTWASSVTLPAKQVIPLGTSMPVEEAATFFVNPATAWVLCCEEFPELRGDTLLQTAAASNLGRMIIRLGKREGFKTVSVVRRREQVDELRAIGADYVVVFDAANDEPQVLRDQLERVGLDRKIRFAIDPVGGPLVASVLSALADDARLILYGSLADADASISPRHLLTTGQKVEGFWLGPWMEKRSLLQKLRLVRTLKALHNEGVTTTETFVSYPPSQIAEAVSAAENAHSGEKVLIRFDGPAS